MKEANGLTYQDYGQSETPVLCLHGIGGDSNSFRPQLESLSEKFRVISLNLPGYGGSQRLSDTTFKNLSAKICDFMSTLGVNQAHLCGQSIGGMISLEIAFLFPKFVKSLALIATTSAFGGKDETFKERFISARLKPLDEGLAIQDLAKKFIPEIVGSRATKFVTDQAIESMSKVSSETYRDIIRCLVTFNRRDQIKNLDVPCCLISGDEDTNAPARTMEKMADTIPNSEYHNIVGAGHLTNLEESKRTNEILFNFYRGLT